jgi:hypothetical protein
LGRLNLIPARTLWSSILPFLNENFYYIRWHLASSTFLCVNQLWVSYEAFNTNASCNPIA